MPASLSPLWTSKRITPLFDLMIRGVPYGKNKRRGDRTALERWSKAVEQQTKDAPRVDGPCAIRVTFLLPPDKFPKDLPFGPDLDNLLKPLLDGLKRTVFREDLGYDSCVIELHAMKVCVATTAEAGAKIEIGLSD